MIKLTFNEKTRIVLFVIYILFFIINFSNICYSQTIKASPDNFLKNKDEKIIPDFYLLESEIDDGNYISGDIFELGFKKYNWGDYLPLNENLKTRMITFRAIFYVSEDLKEEDLSLFIKPIAYPYKTYLNEVDIFMKGIYKENRFNDTISSSGVYLSRNILKYGENEANELTIQTYPLDVVTTLSVCEISSFSNVSNWVFWENFFNSNLTIISSFISLVIFLFFLFNFFKWKFLDFSYLYFSLVCLFYFLFYVNITFLTNAFYQVILDKIARLSIPFSCSFLSLFVLEISKSFNKKLLLKFIIIVPSLIFSLHTIFYTPPHIPSIVFGAVGICLPLLLFNMIVIIISLRKERNITLIIALIDIVILLVVAGCDVFFVVLNVMHFTYFLPYGYLFLLISIFFLLATEQSNVYFEREKTQKRLDELTIKIHNSLKNKLDSARNLLNHYMIKKGNEKEEDIVIISNLITHCSKESKNILFVIKHSECDIKTFITEVNLRAALTLAPIRAKYVIDYECKNQKLILKSEITQCLLEIITELFNNIEKHSSAKNVEISMDCNESTMSLSVLDDGIGFDITKEVEKKSSYGLKIIRDLVEEVKGTIDINSELNKGTITKITIKKYYVK